MNELIGFCVVVVIVAAIFVWALSPKNPDDEGPG